MRWASLVLLVGCGRISFDPPASARDSSMLDEAALADALDAQPGVAPSCIYGTANAQTTATVVLSVPMPPVQTSSVLLVAAGWNDATSSVAAITDDAGNTYTQLTGVQTGGAMSQVLYIVPTPVAIPALTKTLSVTFSQAVVNTSVRIAVIENATQTTALTIGGAGGTGITASVFVPTTMANSFLVGAIAATSSTMLGPGYSILSMSIPLQHAIEGRVEPVAGTFDVDATFSVGSDWVVQGVVFTPL